MFIYKIPPNEKQYKKYYLMLSAYLNSTDTSQKAIQPLHEALKDYFNVKSIKKKNINKTEFSKYISQVEMLLARERGFALNK